MNTIIDNATISALPVTTTAIRRTAAVAALILSMQVVAACGSEQAATDAVHSGSSSVKVQSFGSADALERRASAKSGNRFGSADSLERQLASAERSGACTVSADAAERLGRAAC